MSTTILRINLNGVNCYLIKTEKGFILFDTGGHIVTDKKPTSRRELLTAALESAGCTGNDLRLIVLTHGDCDHAFNAAYIKNLYQAKIAIHVGDKDLVENPTLQKWMESFSYRSLSYRLAFVLLKKTITKVTQRSLADFDSFKPDIYLLDGDTLLAYGLDAQIVHIPGHSLGSIGILFPNGDLIAGDTWANVKKPCQAQNALNFDLLDSSLAKLKKLPVKMIYPGHGVPFERSAVPF